jgi:tight adherence protein C
MPFGDFHLSYGAFLGGLGLLAVGLGLGIYVLTSAARRDLAARLRRLYRDYRGEGTAGQDGHEDLAPPTVQDAIIAILDTIAETLGRFTLTNVKQQEKLRGLLLQSGIRRADAPRLLMAAKVVSLLLGAVSAGAIAMGQGLPSNWLVPVALAGGLAGGMLPEMLLAKQGKMRLSRITQRLPDAFDLLIIFANAGYGIDQAVQRLSHEMRRSAPDLSDELRVTSDELRMLSDRTQAFENLATRTGLTAIRSLVSTLTQAQKYGTPLSQALRVLAAEQRNERVHEIEERAARMPVLITLPLVSLILPAALIVLCAPAFIQAALVAPNLFGSH